MVRSHSTFAVVSDRFDRAPPQRLAAEGFFLRRGGLLENVGITPVVAASEISRCVFPAQIAVDTLVIDEKNFPVTFSEYLFAVSAINFRSFLDSVLRARVFIASACEKNGRCNCVWQARFKSFFFRKKSRMRLAFKTGLP